MFKALDHLRGHHEKQKMVGVWMKKKGMTLVPHAKGNFFRDMGELHNFVEKPKIQGCWLLSIETLYLMERGSLILYLSNERFQSFMVSNEETFDYSTLKQISLIFFYNLAFSDNSDLHDKYQVYCLLKRLGYIVRASSRFERKTLKPVPMSTKDISSLSQAWAAIASLGFNIRMLISRFSITSTHFVNYTLVYEKLQYIPARNALDCKEQGTPDRTYDLHFDVWKPTSKFSKKNHRNPDFQVCVINTSEVKFPSFLDMVKLWEQSSMKVNADEVTSSKDGSKKSRKPADQSSKKQIRARKITEKRLTLAPKTLKNLEYIRLRDSLIKMGSSGRSVVIAGIDNGIINFSGIHETEFALKSNHFNKDLNELKYGANHGIIIQEDSKL